MAHPFCLVERHLRIDRSEVLIDLLLQSTSCGSLVFTPQLSPCGSPLTGCLSPRGESLLSLRFPGDGISSFTRLERAEMEEGRRAGGVACCVCVCVCACMLVGESFRHNMSARWKGLGTFELRARLLSAAFPSFSPCLPPRFDGLIVPDSARAFML